MRGVHGRSRGRVLDAEKVPNRPIVEVGVVAKEEGHPLPLRQSSDRLLNAIVSLRGSGGAVGRRPESRPLATSRLGESGIHDHSPKPRFKRPLVPEACAPSHCGRERVLNDVAGGVTVTKNRRRYGAKLMNRVSVHGLDLLKACAAHFTHLLVMTRHLQDSCRGGLTPILGDTV
jgi:hypothetical protein